MKRFAVVLVLFLLSSGVVVAGDYETVLYTTDLNIDFRMKGWEFSRVQGTDIVIDFKYNLSLANDAYNTSDITGFDLLLRNDTHVITRKELQTFTVTQGEWTARQDRFTVSAEPEQITQMTFRANHTALHEGGQEVMRMVESRRAFELEVTNQTIASFTTNVSRAYREEPIFIDVETGNVFELSADGEALTRGDAGRFYGWLPVPTDLETGNQSVQYVLETARGQRFVETLTYEVLNRPPQFTTEYDKNIVEGDDLPVRVFAVDDTGVANVSVRFRDAVRWNASSSPRFTLPTAGLSNGTYTFDVAATDVEGVTTTGNRSFRITAPRPDAGEDGNGDGGTDYSELSVLEGIITFFQGFIDFLLP